jgi:LmbE family N-acetylglucosaminyl deacetylase
MKEKIICSYKPIFAEKERIMVVFSHPDDAEIYAGGTIARLTAEGKRVRVVKMTSGEKGSRQEKYTEEELKSTRQSEDKKSMEILGILPEDNIYLGLGDGRVDNSIETIEKIVRQIREFKPDLIMTHNPEDVVIRFDAGVNWVNHRDHRNTGKSAVDAAYPYSRDINFFPEHFKEPGLASHSVSEFMFVDYYDHPDVVNIDVTDTIDKKTAAIAAHSSQYSEEDASDSTHFFTDAPDKRNYEKFRWVIAD